jgi:hypothetical protein
MIKRDGLICQGGSMDLWDKIKSATERTVNFVTGGLNDRRRSERIVRSANEEEEWAKKRLEECRIESKQVMDNLGELRAKVYNTTVKEFVCLYEQIAKISAKEFHGFNENVDQHQLEIDIKELKVASEHVQEMLIGGSAGAVGGATLAFGAWGLAGMVGTASTGTAIGTLSGVAATYATLAWLGGGAASAGGLGVAGGTAVLGGIALVPAAIVAMYFGQNQAKKRLNEARNFSDEVDVFVAEVDSFVAQISQIVKGAQLMTDVINALDVVVTIQNKKMNEVIHSTVACVERLQRALEIEFIAEDGMVNVKAIDQYTALASTY